jgi:hypothetical protein
MKGWWLIGNKITDVGSVRAEAVFLVIEYRVWILAPSFLLTRISNHLWVWHNQESFEMSVVNIWLQKWEKGCQQLHQSNLHVIHQSTLHMYTWKNIQTVPLFFCGEYWLDSLLGYANLSEDLPHHQLSSLYKAGAAWYVSLTTPRPATIMQREVSEQWRCEHEHMLGFFTQTGQNKSMYNTTGWYVEANWNLTSSNLLYKCSFYSLVFDNETWCPK